MESIKAWYHSLDERDQKITVIAGVIVSMLVLYLFILEPLETSVTSLQKKVSSQQKTVDWMKQKVSLIRGSQGGSASSKSRVPLATVINTTTNKYSLPVSRRDSRSPNEMQVWFDNVPFNAFLQWSSEIKSQYGVTIVTVNIRSRNRDGIASINVKLLK